MTTNDLFDILPVLFGEIAFGSPDPTNFTFMLNRGDVGLLASLDNLSASAASAVAPGGSTIAAHTEHVRYGLAILNRWAAGEPKPWKDADWTLAWKKPTVSEEEWRVLRDDLRQAADTWRSALGTPRELQGEVGCWVIGSIAHVAYHLGAIRQMDRAVRGPTAEDERPYQLR